MTGPRIDLPTHSFNLLSTGEEIKFRPFLEKERKVLLMALESNQEKEIIDAIKNIIKSCIVSPENFDIGTLASFDLDMLFLNIRARSISEVVTPSYQCKNTMPDGKECNGSIEILLNILDVKPVINPDHDRIIRFNDKIGLRMKYPTFSLMDKMPKVESEVDANMQFVIECIEYIFDQDTIYHIPEDMTREEVEDFILHLTSAMYDKIENFFATMPRLEEKFEKKCPKCGFIHTVILDDVSSFFE